MAARLIASSLRLRLAMWYGALTFSVVSLVCVYSFAVHSRAHYDEIDATLSAAADHVAEEVEASQTQADLARVLEASLHLGSVVRVYDSAGAVTLRSADDSVAPALGLTELRASKSYPAYPRIASLSPEMQHIIFTRGRFAVMSGPERWRIHLVKLPAGNRTLATLLSLNHIDDSVRRFGFLMVLLALVGGLASFGFGFLVAGRALRPVSLLTDAAAQIARTREFTRRVGGNPSGDELGQLANTFDEMLVSLEQAYTAQKRFVSDASHELRAPLTVIQANLELLRRSDGAAAEDGQARQEAVEQAYRETTRLSRLVADLLVLARADAGIPLQHVPVEVDRIVMDVVGEARHLAKGQQLEIVELQPCVLTGDPDRLRQLLLNLVTNAIKYTPAGGRVSVRLQREDQSAALIVSDTGIGIAPEEVAKVFERFYRADPARTNDTGGTGLGLPIVRWIAEQHGGRVDLQSVAEKGTTVTVYLPLSR